MERRDFLADFGLGFTGLAMGSMLAADGIVRGDATPTGEPHFAPRAKSIVWVFLSGGYSQMETFDPKPMLTKYAGKTYAETPFPNPVDSPLHRERFRSAPAEEINIRDVYTKIFPMQVGFARHGESGIAVTDWWPHLAKQVDDICFVRNMWTTDNDHAAENQIHTGRHKLDETQPSIGAWAHYGLGSLNEDLPRFVVLGGPTRTDTRESIDSYYLGPAHAGVPLKLDPKNPLAFGTRRGGQTARQQANEFDLVAKLNRLTAGERPEDARLAARIKSYELAYRMQSSVPEILDLSDEPQSMLDLYGINGKDTSDFGRQCLLARRMAETGVRYIELTHANWDQHNGLRGRLQSNCRATDQPLAALLTDLDQRGMLEEPLVVWGGEFGRTPHVKRPDGRDHNSTGFTFWMAGGGVRGGMRHGATDEHGIAAVEDKMHFHDLHATMLHLLGLDHTRLTYNYAGRDFRLTDVYGKVARKILA